MQGTNLQKHFKGRKYDYQISFRWMEYSFNWLRQHWNGQNVWYLVQQYPHVVYEFILRHYHVDLLNCSIMEWVWLLTQTGVIVVRGTHYPPKHAWYKLYQQANYVLEYYFKDGMWYYY